MLVTPDNGAMLALPTSNVFEGIDVHWEIREAMTEKDVECILQRARAHELYCVAAAARLYQRACDGWDVSARRARSASRTCAWAAASMSAMFTTHDTWP